MNHQNLLLFTLLITIDVAFPTVHAAPLLTITPASTVVNQGASASYHLTLSGGTPNATYVLALVGLPVGSYSFSPKTIESSSSSTLVVQSVIPTSIYCPGSYSFTVTASNLDNASTTGTFIVMQSTPPLVVAVSTNKSTYAPGEYVGITITTNTAAEGTLTISPPSGPSSVTRYHFTQAGTYTENLRLNATSPAGTWAATFLADNYCGLPAQASETFNVIPTAIITTMTTATTTYLFATNATVTTTATESTTFIVTETGSLTSTYSSISTTATTQTTTFTATLPQATSTTTVTLWKIEHPVLEPILTIILVLSVLSLFRRVKPGKGSICIKCRFSNPPATSYCVKCGERLKKTRLL